MRISRAHAVAAWAMFNEKGTRPYHPPISRKASVLQTHLRRSSSAKIYAKLSAEMT